MKIDKICKSKPYFNDKGKMCCAGLIVDMQKWTYSSDCETCPYHKEYENSDD